ncbi:ABC transporter ATP-binding protein [Rothia uropygialis]|uniref:ABC transporter ATP-binding protein n=1 Tax=Kocuria sp. 36 TaxID=1415402 RepID=UPI00101CD59B|nr:ABC transporter ATP-binding protein [Kocuria sp. 36]
MSERRAEGVGVRNEDKIDLTKSESKAVRKRSFRLLASLVKPVLWPAVGTLALVIVSEGLGALGPALTGWGIDIGLPQLKQGHPAALIAIVVAYIVSAVISALTVYLNETITAKISQSILYRIRRRTFAHVQRLSLDFHEKYTSGRVISRLTSDLETMREFLDSGLSQIASSLLSMVMMAVIVIALDWHSAVVIGIALIPMIALTVWFRKRSEVQYRAQRISSAQLIGNFTETMTGIRAVMAFRRQPSARRSYMKFADRYRQQNLRSVRLFGIYMPGVMLLSNLTVAVVLVVGGYNVLHGVIAVGALLSLVLYTQRIFDPLMDLSSFYNTLQSATAALEKVSGLLQERPSVADPDRPRAPGGTSESRGRLQFDQVTFSYREESTNPVLPTLDLNIPAGQKVALVGQTGAGKSTIAKLIARFYDVSSGRILLDGVDLRDLRDTDLRQEIVMVTQESYLFSGSVADNIALGRPGATRSEIVRAAQQVGADEFIRKLPEGYDTDLNRRGGRVSAGQRQLLSFARAFLADPAVLILDEATASMDLPSEKLVQRGLSELLGGRTAVVIAHRLSTILDSDRVLVVADGRVVEDGSPQTLIDAGGRFSELHEAWLSSVER